jgi:hypothetical protein
MIRSARLLFLLLVAAPPVAAQRLTGAPPARDLAQQRASFQRTLVHNGKWLTAASVAAFSVAAASEHRRSRREWDQLLTICRSDASACEVGSDGRYQRADAEALYQRSRAYDRRANRWLVGAQLSLIATTALFIIDLHPGEGPENIPFPSEIRVGSVGGGTGVEMRLAF